MVLHYLIRCRQGDVDEEWGPALSVTRDRQGANAEYVLRADRVTPTAVPRLPA